MTGQPGRGRLSSEHNDTAFWADWGGDVAAVVHEAARAAAIVFPHAIRRYGLTADDIGMEGVAKLLGHCRRRGEPPTRRTLWWAVNKAGLDVIARTGDAAERRRRARHGGLVEGTTTRGDVEALRELRLSLADTAPQAIVFNTDPDGWALQVGQSASESLEELVQESVHWDLAAARLRRQLDVDGTTGANANQAFARLVDEVAWMVAWRAADPAVRRAYAEEPRLTIWAAIRTADPDRLGGYPADGFPPHDHEADRRRAFRLAKRAADAIDGALRDVHDEAARDEESAA